MFIIVEILTDANNALKMVSDTIFPSEETAKDYLNKKVQKQINNEAQYLFDKIKNNNALSEFKNLNQEELVIKNFIILPITSLITLHNEKLF